MERRSQHRKRGHLLGRPNRHRPGQKTAQTVADQMDRAISLGGRSRDYAQEALGHHVDTVGIEANPSNLGAVAETAKPSFHWP
jgi:hypothetical protein